MAATEAAKAPSLYEGVGGKSTAAGAAWRVETAVPRSGNEAPRTHPSAGRVECQPGDDDKNARFDHILVTADQYVAGPYAEGPYEISLPITAKMIVRIKPEYRPSFEPRPGAK